MRTPHVHDRLGEYLDGDLSGQELQEVEAHLNGCARCARELAYLRQVRSLLAARPPARSPGLWRQVAPRIAASGLPGAWGQFEWVGKRLMPLLAAAAVLAAAFLGRTNGNGTAASLESYLKSAFAGESADSLIVSESEISRGDVLYLAATTPSEGRR